MSSYTVGHCATNVAAQQFNPYPNPSVGAQIYTNQAHLYQPQIAPWTQYMRKPVATAVQSNPLPSLVSAAATTTSPVGTTCALPSNMSFTKRHNPYANDGGATVTTPPLSYTAHSISPNPLIIDRTQQSSSLVVGNNNNNNISRADRGERSSQSSRQITVEEVRQQLGTLVDLAHSANGSAFLQAAIRGNHSDSRECVDLISAELLPHLGDLLLDSHGCYIIKTLMERMPIEQLQAVMTAQIAPDESLVYSLCTHSLHTRRVVQFLLETVDCTFLIETITARCSEIATTQQGCIVVQRAMDVAEGTQRVKLFGAIQLHFNAFCFDPFANYVLQHMFSVGDVADVARGVWPQIKGNVISLSCNKFASNVVEKCLSNFPIDLQHELLREMYDVSEERLLSMLQDSFGNYIVQTSIALAPQKDIPFMRAKLLAVLDRTPYGHKIESRLERRRKGAHTKSEYSNNANNNNTTGNGQVVANPHVKHHNDRPHQNHHKGHRGSTKVSITPVAPVAEGEEPW